MSFFGDNATLTMIREAGVEDAYGDPAEGPIVWQGRAAGYLRRIRATAAATGRQSSQDDANVRTDQTTDVFFLRDQAGGRVVAGVGVSEGYRVTIEDRRTLPPNVVTWRVGAMEHRMGGGLPVDSQKWGLEPNVTA